MLPRSFRRRRTAQAGVSFIESVAVTLVLGLVIWLGVFSIEHMLQQGRESRTRARLVQVKDCLVKRAAFNNRYPTYHPGRLDCDELSYDVNACLCQGEGPALDAWGQELRYIEGLDTYYRGLREQRIMPESSSETMTRLHGASRIIEKSGETTGEVAFVLLSTGKDTIPDPPGGQPDWPDVMDSDAPLDFSAEDANDIYLAVTAGELRKAVEE